MAPRSELPVGGEEIGAEFITWLWHAGQNGEEFVVDKAPVRIAVGEHIKLRALDGHGAEVVLKGENAGSCAELFSALHRGALIVNAKVQIDLNGTVVSGVLKASTASITACKLPKEPEREAATAEPFTEEGEKPGVEQDRDRQKLSEEARLLSRMSWIDQAQGALDACLEMWLKLRTDGRHPAWSRSFKKWVAENVAGQTKGRGE